MLLLFFYSLFGDVSIYPCIAFLLVSIDDVITFCIDVAAEGRALWMFFTFSVSYFQVIFVSHFHQAIAKVTAFSVSAWYIKESFRSSFFFYLRLVLIFFFIELRAFSGLHFLYAFTEINSFLSVLCVWWKATKGNGFFVFCFLALEEPLPRV